jgi:hypothetical protein
LAVLANVDIGEDDVATLGDWDSHDGNDDDDDDDDDDY